MITEMLGTKTKTRIAKLFSQESGPFSVSDVARKLGISKSRASECLREMREGNLLERRDMGRTAAYTLARGSVAQAVAGAFRQEADELLKIEKTVVSRASKLKPVSIVLFGSATRGLKIGSDVDFLLVYRRVVDEQEIYRISGELTGTYGLHVSIITMGEKEFREKARRGEEFIVNIMATHKLIYGKELEELVW